MSPSSSIEVGQLADLDAARAVLAMVREGRPGGVGIHGRAQIQPLTGQQRRIEDPITYGMRVGAGAGAVHRGMDRPQRVGVGDRPIASHRQGGSLAVQGTEGKVPCFTLGAEEAEFAFDDLGVAPRPQRLNVRHHTERGEA
jgi:hypothetical protein